MPLKLCIIVCHKYFNKFRFKFYIYKYIYIYIFILFYIICYTHDIYFSFYKYNDVLILYINRNNINNNRKY